MDEETRRVPVNTLVALYKKSAFIGDGTQYFENILADEARLTPAEKAFCEFALDILAIVPHACTVERINKAHGHVCSKARAAMNDQTVGKQLYIVVNEAMLRKREEARAAHLAEAKREACTATDLDALKPYSLEDADIELSSIAVLEAHDCLPAEKQKEKSNDNDDDDDDDDVEEHVAFDKYSVPDGFTLVNKPESFIKAADASNYYVLMYFWESATVRTKGMWWLGAIENFNQQRKRKFKIKWRENEYVLHDLKLEDYYDAVAKPPPQANNWVYLKANRNGGRKRARDDDPDDGQVEMSDSDDEVSDGL